MEQTIWLSSIVYMSACSSDKPIIHEQPLMCQHYSFILKKTLFTQQNH